MKILVRILGGLVGLLLVLAVIGLFLPSERTVSRSVVIDAPAATVFALVNGFHHFNRFSPWVERDPEGEYAYSGPSEGVGATMSWNSESIGNGEQEITASEPYHHVEGVIRFDGQGSADIAFDIVPLDEGSEVTWTFHIDVGWDLLDRYFGLLMDDLVGEDYEEGLKNLKDIAEAYPKFDLAGFEPELVEIEETQIASMRKRTAMEPEAMVASMAAAFQALDSYLQLNEIEPVGKPRVITREWNEAEATWTFDAAYAIPIDSFVERGVNGIERDHSYAGPALEVILEGADWETSTMTYEKVDLYMQLRGYKAAGDSWEAYESDPITTPPEELVTHIVFPVEQQPLQ